MQKKYNSDVIEGEKLSLTTQFRCLGGDDYISFINSVLGYDDVVKKYRPKNYDFKVFETPTDLYKAIKQKQYNYKTARLLAGYAYDWNSKKDPELYDFNLDEDKFKMRWNMGEKIPYILNEDENDRIGSNYTIQGIDMDYAGVIIGKDLRYINGKVIPYRASHSKDDKNSGIWSKTTSLALANKLIRNAYKVLLTRAIYDTYIYCEDKALNEYLKSLIK